MAAVALLILLLFVLARKAVPFGGYVDDVKWVLAAENFLKGSLRAQCMYFPYIELMNWGTSVLLMPVLALFGRNIPVLQLYSVTALFFGTLMFFSATAGNKTAAGKVAYLFVLALNGFVFSFLGGVTSEVFYLFLFGALVYLGYAKKWACEGTVPQTAALAVLSGLLVMTRSVGALAVAGTAVEMLLARRYRALLLYCGVVSACVLPSVAVSKLSSGAFTFYESYWGLLLKMGPLNVLNSAASNLYYYAKGLACLTFINLPALLPPGLNSVKAAFIVVFAALCAVGMARNVKNDPLGRFLALYFALYLLVYALWMYFSPRYALPVYPVFVYWVFKGIEAFLPGENGLPAFAALLCAAAVTNYGAVRGTIAASLDSPPEIGQGTYGWIKRNTRPDDLIVSMDIARIYFYAQRRGLPSLAGETPEEFVANARALKARYLVLKEASYTESNPNAGDPIVRQYGKLKNFAARGDLLDKIYENAGEGTAVYKFRNIEP